MFLINARMSRRSARGYAHIPSLTRPLLARLAGVAAQSPDDARRLAALGATAPVVTGNVKFDIAVSPDVRALGHELRKRFGATRPVWVAASTRDGEEALILDALAQAPLPRETLLVIVPRHPQRFADVAGLLAERGVAFVRRSDNQPVPADVGIVLGDSMGELLAYYAAADVAFIGGSLLPLGGQNLIEALAVGAPVLIGPHTFNFNEAAHRRGRRRRSPTRCRRGGASQRGRSAVPRSVATRRDARGGGRISRGAPRCHGASDALARPPTAREDASVSRSDRG